MKGGGTGVVKVLSAPGVPSSAGQTWSQAIQDGRWVFISGQIAMDGEGNVIGAGDPVRQAHEVFERIGALLAAAGGSFRDLRKITTFVTSMEYRPAVAAARARYLSEPYPTSTLVAVSGLVHPDLLIEVDAVACIGGGANEGRPGDAEHSIGSNAGA